MPQHRTPLAKAKVTGAVVAHSARFSKRREPKSNDLGKPSEFLDQNGRRAWAAFQKELPWLTESDRALVEIASKIRGQLLGGENVNTTALSMLQSILSKMGATPADKTRVMVPDGETEEDEFFGPN